MFFETLGWFGSFLIILAYYLLQTDKIEETDFKYQTINILGALMLGVNAYYKTAWAILTLQAVWILIGVMGILKSKSAR
ncbi:MAG: hypothetical protein UX26_C0037G0009 [Parcubacteria group bacterium GW2011_GWC1_45_9]|nr:MAG: hypothetical protein UW85_C0020G0006 [Parcubacteria group bacterium GW2011_GWA1_Parcubacteria_45_10]KKT88069.1 MAG: hypothetical protein UW89_C0012G0009 [Parcubacteria group bacterium GW2011_GWB1_45_10]KKU16064.1 MAG: hypothetical protein UX26_C0037G0009 [Parcubacteria group bacterium GW2011_GWC1_45_9]HCI05439.1 hypothetical protein [Patescibacteria group bacterium]